MPSLITTGFLVTGSPIAAGVLSQHLHIQPPYPASVSPSLMVGSKNGTQPIDEIQAAKGGNHALGFGFNDWYNRIHVDPRNVALGNLLTTQVRTISVWNGFVSPITLTNIAESNADGVTLGGNMSFPVPLLPLEVKSYTLTTDVIGPPVIDALYAFTFSTGLSLYVNVTGKRVVVFPFMPQRGVRETLEWKTDLMRAKAGEQRVMLRYEPRQEFDYDFFMTDAQYAQMRALMYGWGSRVFAVPVWTEYSRLGELPQGATSIVFDTRYADYRDGDVLILWESEGFFETVEIDTVSETSISLLRPTLNNYTNALIAPLRFARALAGAEATKDANTLIRSGAQFLVTANKDISAGIGLPTYKGLDVMDDILHVVGTVQEKIFRDVEIVDNGVASPAVFARRNYADQTFTVSWSPKNRSELWRLRQWFHSRKGRAKAFWLPTRTKDFTVLDDVSTSSSSLRVLPIGYPLYYGVRDIQIKLKNGTVLRNRITSGASDGYGTESLILENQVGATFTTSDIDYVCLMHKVRFDSDRVEIVYSPDGFVTVSIPCTEVPQ